MVGDKDSELKRIGENLLNKISNGDCFIHFWQYGLKDNEVFLPTSISVKYDEEKNEVRLDFDEVKKLAFLLEQINVRRLKMGFVPVELFPPSLISSKLGLESNQRVFFDPVGFGFKTVGFLNFIISKVEKMKNKIEE